MAWGELLLQETMALRVFSILEKCYANLSSLWDVLVSQSIPLFSKSECVAGFETQLCRRHRSPIRVFCHSHAFLHFCCLGGPPVVPRLAAQDVILPL